MIKKFKTDFPFLKLKSNIMSESQLIEYKVSWRDEYLKWICGFANDQGNALNSFLMKKIGVILESLIEQKIDELVYKLYGLTPEEIAIVEGK